METFINDIRLLQDFNSNSCELNLQVKLNDEQKNELSEISKALKDKKFICEIKPHRNKRSLDANSYCWVLCEKIAQQVKSTSKEIYKQNILDVGVFEIRPIAEEVKDLTIKRWNSLGLGFLTEELGRSKLDKYVKVKFYFGSHTYNSKEMTRFIDELVSKAQELGIETIPPKELESLKNRWRHYE